MYDEVVSGRLFAYNLRFPGQYFDAETGTHFNWMRDYDPRIGRYIESDPIGLQGGLNTYVYASAAPLSKVDPDGLQAGAAGGGLIGGFGGLGGFGRGGSSSSSNWDGWGGSSSMGGSSTWGGSDSWGGSSSGAICKTKPDEDYCRKRKNYCITYCQYELNMPGRRDNTGPYRACIRRCMNAVGCDY